MITFCFCFAIFKTKSFKCLPASSIGSASEWMTSTNFASLGSSLTCSAYRSNNGPAGSIPEIQISLPTMFLKFFNYFQSSWNIELLIRISTCDSAHIRSSGPNISTCLGPKTMPDDMNVFHFDTMFVPKHFQELGDGSPHYTCVGGRGGVYFPGTIFPVDRNDVTVFLQLEFPENEVICSVTLIR